MIKMEKVLSTGLCQLEKKAVLRYVCVIHIEYVLGMCSLLHLKVKKLATFQGEILGFYMLDNYLTFFFNISNGILKSSCFRLLN